ncbi:MAG: class I SAM-dependent methyltransferase [bacterium]|nr:class I SAM-dependent methyltransferase [bacterium]
MSERPTGQVEWEGKGLDYERYAMNKLFKRLVRDHSIGNVLEIPAKGEKAMPSLYSLPFGEAGCDVTLVNAEEKSRWAWRELDFPVSYETCEDLERTGLPDAGYDLVWNFMQLSQHEDKPALLREMVRLSRGYVMFIAVNRFNPGFFSHRTVHKVFDVPWNHGDIRFMNPYHVRRFFREQGLTVVRTGAVDTPPYPDSLGIRDMKLHRKNVDLNKIDWDSRTIWWMKNGGYPPKLKFMYFFEWLPLPLPLKLIYAHLYYVLARVD